MGPATVRRHGGIYPAPVMMIAGVFRLSTISVSMHTL